MAGRVRLGGDGRLADVRRGAVRADQGERVRDLIVAAADACPGTLADEHVDVWPMSFSHVISARAAAYKLVRS